MPTNKNSASSPAVSSRDNYFWYLEDPWAQRFERSHWWDQTSGEQPNSLAAAYELARRHPQIGRAFQEFARRSWFGRGMGLHAEFEAKAAQEIGNRTVISLCLIGLKSWSQLSKNEREFWIDSAGRIKGLKHFNRRICRSLDLRAKGRAALQFSDHLNAEGAKGESLYQQMVEQAISREAVDALRAGNLVFSIPNDLSREEARTLLTREYARRRRGRRSPQKRCRWQSWLSAISEFENDCDRYQTAKARTFTRYRRIAEPICFEANPVKAVGGF